MMMIGNAIRAGLQSGAIMGVADITTQLCVEGIGNSDDNDNDNDFDVLRTLRWTGAGLLLHGPYFYMGFSIIDRKFGQAVTTWKVVAKKTTAAQFILFPPYLVALFGFMGVLENHDNIKEKIIKRVPEAFISGCVYWPVANSINFKLIPNNFRVPYLAVSAGIWNSYLSYVNQSST